MVSAAVYDRYTSRIGQEIQIRGFCEATDQVSVGAAPLNL